MFSCPFRSVPHDARSIVPQRHRHGFKKLNLPADQRKALLRGLTTQVTFSLDLTWLADCLLNSSVYIPGGSIARSNR